ncbi:MAG TPA: hypothetical protein PKA31_00650 [Candidatus Moranbacteria bacterium]|nr:hypothetical protein [Candidatus Moranbacteria bacterium]
MVQKTFLSALFLLFSLFAVFPVALAGTNVIYGPTDDGHITIKIEPGTHLFYLQEHASFPSPKIKGLTAFRYLGADPDSPETWTEIPEGNYIEAFRGFIRFINRSGKTITLKGETMYHAGAFRKKNLRADNIDFENWRRMDIFTRDFDPEKLKGEVGPHKFLRLEHIYFPTWDQKPLEMTIGEIKKRITYRGKSNKEFAWRKGLKFHGILACDKEGRISGKLLTDNSRKILLNTGTPAVVVLTQKNEYSNEVPW